MRNERGDKGEARRLESGYADDDGDDDDVQPEHSFDEGGDSAQDSDVSSDSESKYFPCVPTFPWWASLILEVYFSWPSWHPTFNTLTTLYCPGWT